MRTRRTGCKRVLPGFLIDARGVPGLVATQSQLYDDCPVCCARLAVSIKGRRFRRSLFATSCDSLKEREIVVRRLSHSDELRLPQYDNGVGSGECDPSRKLRLWSCFTPPCGAFPDTWYKGTRNTDRRGCWCVHIWRRCRSSAKFFGVAGILPRARKKDTGLCQSSFCPFQTPLLLTPGVLRTD